MIKNAFIAVFMLFSACAFADETRYSAIIEELPLMSSMTEHTADAVVFDTEGGRILETFVSAASPRTEVGAFYDTALAALGWSETSDFVYVRDDETLKITFEGDTLVHFSLSPKGK